MMLDSAFKDTVIGRIPCDWTIKSVSSMTMVTAGGTPSTARAEFWKEEIPWMRSGDIHKKFVRTVDGRISELGLNSSSATLLPPNCVLIALAGQGKTRGTVAINEIELSTNQSIAAIYPTANLNSRYLYYYLDSKYDELRGMSQGDGGRGGLNLTIIGKINFPYPDIPEQRAIATALADVDALIEAKRVLLEKKRAIKQGTMQELLTGNRRLPGFPVTPMKHTEIGVLPEDWEVKTLGEIGVVKMCKRIFKHETSAEGDVPFFKIGTFGQQPDAYISREKFNVYRSLYPYPQKGTPLISAAGTIGRVVVYDGQDAYYQDSNIVWLEHEEKDILNTFLRYYYSVINWVTETGSAITRLYNNNILSSQVALPTMKEQAAIASVLADIDSEIATLEQALEKLVDLKQGMMQNLLTGRIRLV